MDGSKSGIMPEADNNQQCPSRFITTIRRLIRPTNKSLGQQPITWRELVYSRGVARSSSGFFLLSLEHGPLVTECNVATLPPGRWVILSSVQQEPPSPRGNAVRERLSSDYTAVFLKCRVILKFLPGQTRWFDFDVTTRTDWLVVSCRIDITGIIT